MGDIAANKQICVNFLTGLSKRRFRAILDFLDDNIVWWLQGSWDVPTEYHGKTGVKVLLDVLDDAIAGDLAIEFGHITAEEDRVSIEMRSHAALKNGRTYRMTYHYLFRLRDDLIIEGKEYLDTKHLAEAIFG